MDKKKVYETITFEYDNWIDRYKILYRISKIRKILEKI
jgi:hypothetical protein